MTKEPAKKYVKASDVDQNEYDAKKLAKDVFVKDLVGAEDWKRSKTGYLTGFSVFRKSFGSLFNNFSGSIHRVSSLWASLLSSEDVKALPEGGSPEDRFRSSMFLHGKSESDLRLIIENTWRSTWLYVAISAVGFLIICASFFYVNYNTKLDGLLRFAPLFVTIPLVFKHAYTNWMVRNKRLDSALNYLRSGELLPQKNMAPNK